jgi:casein kinase II subunit alpha
MGRVATPSVARIYADVNAKLGPSWHEYGELGAISQSCVCGLSFLPDNLQVQWGSQDHYEIVRKVGRGKYSEVRFFCINVVPSLELLSGLRGDQHRK